MNIKNSSQSERLDYMLKGTVFGCEHGRIEKISKKTGYARSAVKRWLLEDALPRNPKDRIEVAQKLGVDLLYWEYGINYTSLNETTITDVSIYRAIFQAVDGKESQNVITEYDMTKIKEIIHCAAKLDFYKDLVNLIDHLIDFKIESLTKNDTLSVEDTAKTNKTPQNN